MTAVVVRVVAVAVVLAGTSACGVFNRAASSADDIAKVVLASEDDVLVLARQQARSTGSTADDVLAGWRGRVLSSSDDIATRYAQVPPELRSMACDAVTDVLADAVDGDPTTDPSVLLSTAAAIASGNATHAARSLADDLAGAAQDVLDGKPAALTLLLIRAGTCEAAG